MSIKWTLKNISFKDLKKHPSNPRSLSKSQYEHLKKSIDKFGLIDKIIVNLTSPYTIIGGHQRYEVLKKEKITQADCWVPDRELNEDEVKELMIRLNKNSGSFDYEILANEFEVPDLLDWGFTPDEMDLLLDEIPEEENNTKAKKKTECPNCNHIF